MAAASVSWLAHETGQLSLGHSGFMAVGAYAMALAVNAGVPWLAAVLVAIAAAGLAGAAVSWLGGAARGPLFSLLTLGFGLAVPRIALLLGRWTGGSQGLSVEPATAWPGSDWQRLVAVAAVGAALVVAASSWQRGWLGASWRLQRDRPDVATSYGLSPRRLRTYALGLSAAATGGAGALLALLTGLVSPYDFGLAAAFQLVVAAAAGGLGSTAGAMLSAAVLTIVPFVASALAVGFEPEWIVVSQGLLLLAAVRGWPWLRGQWGQESRRSAQERAPWLRQRRAEAVAQAAAAAGTAEAAEAAEATDIAEAREAAAGRGAEQAAEAGVPAAGVGAREAAAGSRAWVNQAPGEALGAPSARWLAAAGVKGRPGQLDVRELSVSRGALKLKAASFSLTAAVITVLRGENGSGKSSLLAGLSGHVVTSGSRRVNGHELHLHPPSVVAKRGVARTWQGGGLAPGLTVGEHLALARLAEWKLSFAAVPGLSNLLWRRELRALADLGGPLEGLIARPAMSLSGGQAAFVQLLAAARRRPAVLLLDEPFAGMAASYRPWAESVIRTVAADGTAVLAVEHRHGWLEGAHEWRLHDGQLMPDRVTVIDADNAAGRAAADGCPSSARATEGGKAACVDATTDPAALQVCALRFGYGNGPDLSPPLNMLCPRGTVTGLSGPNGSGKSTLLHVLAGRLPARGGEVRVGGTIVNGVIARQRHGVVLVPQHGGVFPDLTVAEQLQLAEASARRRRGNGIEHVRSLLPPVAGWLDRPARQLSGGQQQIVALARAIAMYPAVLLLDEPTAGLDAAAQRLVANALKALQAGGAAIVVVEHNVGWLAELAADLYELTPAGLVRVDAACEASAVRPALAARTASAACQASTGRPPSSAG